mmetsp:Transcript_57558/g.169077  ORF Transcript_57558/g.169077 Transcript_57558/m.169077 type:complete len:285 (-) Transcript_57558:719-1573(-)
MAKSRSSTPSAAPSRAPWASTSTTSWPKASRTTCSSRSRTRATRRRMQRTCSSTPSRSTATAWSPSMPSGASLKRCTPTTPAKPWMASGGRLSRSTRWPRLGRGRPCISRTAPSCAPAWRGTWSLRRRRHSVPGRRSATCSPARPDARTPRSARTSRTSNTTGAATSARWRRGGSPKTPTGRARSWPSSRSSVAHLCAHRSSPAAGARGTLARVSRRPGGGKRGGEATTLPRACTPTTPARWRCAKPSPWSTRASTSATTGGTPTSPSACPTMGAPWRRAWPIA